MEITPGETVGAGGKVAGQIRTSLRAWSLCTWVLADDHHVIYEEQPPIVCIRSIMGLFCLVVATEKSIR